MHITSYTVIIKNKTAALHLRYAVANTLVKDFQNVVIGNIAIDKQGIFRIVVPDDFLFKKHIAAFQPSRKKTAYRCEE